MSYRFTVLLFTIVQSAATVLAIRGTYFYGEEHLGFGDPENLILAVLFGVAYVVGAALSHRLTHRLGERRVLVLVMVVQTGVYACMGTLPIAWMLFAMTGPLGLGQGLMWPIVESYLTAGLTPRQTLRVVGRFNLSWASSIVVAMVMIGSVIDLGLPRMLFFFGSATQVICLGIVAAYWAGTPLHLPDDHPERPDSMKLGRYAALLTSSRWAMTVNYIAILMIIPLMPTFFHRLGLKSEQAATGTGSLMDAGRLVAFVGMVFLTAWYGRILPVFASLAGTTLGTVMILLGEHLALVIAGELVLGVSAGVCYYCSLYYALAVKNAAVDAGGMHETLIGAGFFFGPIIGLVGALLAGDAGHPGPYYLVAIAPVLLLSLAAGSWPLLRLLRET